ncbi:MAG: polysaccharide deacetylase family protein [Anaerolineae bacterium]
MTMYIAAYDTEQPACLETVRKIVAMHEKHAMPGTFFLVAGLLEGPQRAEYKALLGDNPLFEVASHSYSHMVVRDTAEFGKAGPLEQFPKEIVESKKRIEDVFGAQVHGFRTPVGSVDGLKQAPDALRLVQAAGYRYVSSLLWGPDWSLPAVHVPPFTYAAEGYPELWELPPCGWHENLLKGNNKCGPKRVGLFPPYLPGTVPEDYIETPEQELQYNNVPFIDKAVAESMPQVSLIWHPWSIGMFDPTVRMLDLTFSYVRERGLVCGTFRDLRNSLA